MSSTTTATKGKMPSTQPFRFMDLPKELRLMVYERLPRQITHTRAEVPANIRDSKPFLILVTRTCSTALLRVSRTVHDEAGTIVQKLLQRWILAHPLRVISSLHFGRDVMDFIVAAAQSAPGQNPRYKALSWFNGRAEYYWWARFMSFIGFNTIKGRVSLGDLFHSDMLGSKFFQFKEQASRFAATGTVLRTEFVIVVPKNPPAFGSQEHYKTQRDFLDIYSFGICMPYYGIAFRIPAVLSRDAVNTVGLVTAQQLEPGLPMQVTSDEEIMTPEEWATSWVPTS
jgi:hypothetical protein